MSLRVIFAGTPEFAVPSLQALLDSAHEVVAVYTQPDRPAGRGRQVQISPVKALARDHSCTILQPRSLDQQSERLSVLAPDVLIVVAYGLILPAPVLDIPPLGCLNVHASLLPRWRGAAPIQRAIEAGDTETGISLMRMDPGLDTGDVLLRVPEAITAADTSQSLHDRLALLGAQNLVPGLERWSRVNWFLNPRRRIKPPMQKKSTRAKPTSTGARTPNSS